MTEAFGLGAVRTHVPMTVPETMLFAAVVILPSWTLGILLASLYVAGAAFPLVIVPMAFHQASLLVLLLSLAGSSLLVLKVHGIWTRMEIALVTGAILAAAMLVTPVILLADISAGLPLGVVLVVLGAAFGPLPLCFWVALRTARSMRLAVDDPAAPSWLRGATAWAVTRYEVVRSRRERTPDGPCPGVAAVEKREVR